MCINQRLVLCKIKKKFNKRVMLVRKNTSGECEAIKKNVVNSFLVTPTLNHFLSYLNSTYLGVLVVQELAALSCLILTA